jgi:Methyltransferase domain
LNASKPSDISGMRQWTRIRRANAVAPLVDLILCPLVAPAALILRLARRLGLQRLPLCRAILMRIGLLPLRRHYYEPFITVDDLRMPLEQERDLTGINWNIPGQLAFLSTLVHEQELVEMSTPAAGEFTFSFDNPAFAAGDAEFLYQVVRSKKPRMIVEIGSGQSTRMAHAAIKRNGEELDGYACRHICIEPYENPWLERLGIDVIRQRVEQVNKEMFAQLDRDDLLFIDSSHVIRPQGDVVTEYLEILPMLRPGVIVHIHDVFSPRDYPAEWLFDKLLLWDEQYLLEAFLTHNDKWNVLAALNLLKHREYAALQRVCPYLTGKREPASIYIQRK